jgi:hypothetical protein
MRGEYELNVRGLAGTAVRIVYGRIGALGRTVVPRAAGLITGREETFCAAGTFACPKAMLTPAEAIRATIKQNAENLDFFINCSAN